jgi:quercetin dioxygenase-like cupin family protein
MTIRMLMSFWMGLVLLVLVPPSWGDESKSLGMSRQLLMKKALPPLADSPEVRVIRVNFPSGFKTPLHTHDAAGPRYVLQGKLRVEDSGKIAVYGPGDVFWETGAPMTIESIGGSDAQMVIFEVGPLKEEGSAHNTH